MASKYKYAVDIGYCNSCSHIVEYDEKIIFFMDDAWGYRKICEERIRICPRCGDEDCITEDPPT